jgi:tripartite-type tricarboxylate transporter receptor subunit TctC
MPLECAVTALALNQQARPPNRTNGMGGDPQSGLTNVTHESCVLIKLVLQLFSLVQCPDSGLAALDMSRRRLIWFARASAQQKEICLQGGPMLLTRREAIAGIGGGLAVLTGLAALTHKAFAEPAYPGQAIKLIVPYPAGGTTDFLGRLVAEQFRTGLGATVVVENKPGAATTLGADQVARSAPDGYTLLLATSTTLAINKALYRKLPYDPVRDFTPIALVAGVPFALIVSPSLPVKTLSEFIAYAKSNPGLAYGSAGNGSPQHLGAEMLKAAAGIDVRHVSYRGGVPAMLDVIAGRIPFMVVDLPVALPQIREGKVRVLGVTTLSRVAVASEIPTLAEAGLPGFELVPWQGVVAPAGLPRTIADRLAAQIATLVADPATRDRLTTMALEPLTGSTPDSFAAYVRAEVDRWADIVRNSGAELE